MPGTRFAAMSAWLLLLATLAAVNSAAGGAMTPAMAFLWLLAAIVPSTILLAVFRGAPPRIINQVLYDGERAPAHASVGRPDRQSL
jgi:hypothetical protein